MARRCSNARTDYQRSLGFQYSYRKAYKGNFHLLAEIDGKERKFVIGKNKKKFSLIEKTGVASLSADQLKAMVEKYFFF